ncbi:MAG: ABC transporter permease [Agriterribacter sp.]
MSLFKTIMHYEWLQLKRNKAFWLLTFIFLLISLYAAWYGNTEVKQQQRKIALVKDAIDNSMNVLGTQLQQHDSAAWEYEPLYKTTFYNKPDGIAALAFGQRDLHKFVIEISEGTYYYNKYATGYSNKTLSGEIVNPQQQLAGHLDMSFVLIFLLPLYFILLTYNLLSAEKELGSLAILQIQSVSLRQLFFAKLLLRWLIAVILVTALLCIAALITGAISNWRFAIFIIATIVYSLCWAGVVSVITILKKSSGFNALLLISTWLFFCMLLPAAFNVFLTAAYPPVNKIALAAAVQKANSEVFAIPRIAVADSFYAIHPHYNNLPGDTLPGGWYNPRWMRSAHAVLDNKVQREEIPYFETLRERMNAESRLNYYSPALLTQSVLTAVAAGDRKQMYAFDTACWHYFKTWNTYLDERIFFDNNRFSKKDFENLPVEVFKPVIDYTKIFLSLLSILLVGAALMIISSLKLSANWS